MLRRHCMFIVVACIFQVVPTDSVQTVLCTGQGYCDTINGCSAYTCQKVTYYHSVCLYWLPKQYGGIAYCDPFVHADCPHGSIMTYSGTNWDYEFYSCQDCPSGKYYTARAPPSNRQSCTDCSGESVSQPKASVCTVCNAGQRANSLKSACEDCPAGTKGSVAGPGCTTCIAGTYTASSGLFSCSACPPGSFSSVSGASACTLCAEGYYWGATEGTVCLPCSAGKFVRTTGSSACSSCELGKYQTGSGSSTCIACEIGKASLSVGSAFEQLFFAGNTGTTCKSCTGPDYSASYANVEGQSQCTLCQAGTYWASSTQPCTACSTGKFQGMTGRIQCSDCDVGQYQDGTGATLCKLCPAGKLNIWKAQTSSNACTDCATGTYGPIEGLLTPGMYAANQPTTCRFCNAGSYQSLIGQTGCSSCASGYYQTGSSKTGCDACAKGTFQSSSGMSVCDACTAGKARTAVGGSTCGICTPGTFSGTMATVCTDCSLGQYQSGSEKSSCIPCSTGKAQPTAARSTCTDCAAGTYASISSLATACISCQPGSYQAASLQTTCSLCFTGRYQSLAGQTSCPACSVGEYSGTDGASKCTACSTGNYLTGTGSSVCLACPAGQFQSASGASLCGTCIAGSYTLDAGRSVCSLCELGQYQSMPQKTTCDGCGYGRFSSSQGQTVCQLCPVGMFSQYTAGDKCVQCYPGEYADTTGSTNCKLCPTGKYQTGHYGTTCQFCAAGQYQANTKSTGCTGCETGKYQTGSGFTSCVACSDCSTGQIWSSGCNAVSNGVCGNCAAGTYVSATGRFSCITCATGTYQTGSRGTACQTCQTCQPGRYQGQACRATADRECLDCQAGTFSSGSNMLVCEGCASGKFQASARGTACSTCMTCDAGFSWGDSCKATQNAVCNPCPYGTFNPSAQTSACLRCGAGTYQDATGGTTCNACSTCTAGRYLASGCTGPENGRCETCTVCPKETVRACGARTDTVCKTDSAVAWWRMTAYSKAGQGGMPALSSITMLGSTFVQYVDFFGDAAFKNVIPGGPVDYYLTTFDLTLRIVQGGTYLICLYTDDWGFLDLDGARLINTWCGEACETRVLASGLHIVYAQQAEDTGYSIARIMYSGPDTNNQRILMPKQIDGLPCLWSPHLYSWTGQDQACRPGEYLTSFSATNLTKTCRVCPDGWAGLNGVYCERCGNLEEPYFLDRSSCVCKWPAVMNASGACVCPDGLQQSGEGCVACGLNRYGAGGTCWACEAGTYTTTTGNTACQACEFGKYRLASQAGACVACVTTGWFAPDPSSNACIACNESCTMDGWRWDRPCPGDTTGRYSVCKECEGDLPANASWVNTTECAYACLDGFFRAEGGGCLACTVDRVCPAGRRLSNCTELSDSNCDTACVDPNKPAVHSHWARGTNCPWACDHGYELRVWDYVMFQLRECALAGSTDCLPGFYLDDGQCWACEAGKYQPVSGAELSGACVACDAGKYQTGTAMDKSGACIACNAGTYQSGTGATWGGACVACGPGTYQPGMGKNTSSACIPCIAGKYQTAAGANTSAACTPCEAGKYSNSTGARTCIPCLPVSYAAMTGSSVCTTCPSGKYNAETGATASTACTDCQPPGGLAYFATLSFCDYCTNCKYLRLANNRPAFSCDGGVYVWWWAGNILTSWGPSYIGTNVYNGALMVSGSFEPYITGQLYCAP